MAATACARPCEGCGLPLPSGSRPNRTHHDARCRKAAFRGRDALTRRADAARELVRAGELDPWLALSYVVAPTAAMERAAA